ncbi:hypothetical protein BC941DRAFT_29484 [Chlamydoabsidia padenii]|nr:hypothetical protein BC941DRAFT_29484 [Chlamydoabsidia padenii]
MLKRERKKRGEALFVLMRTLIDLPFFIRIHWGRDLNWYQRKLKVNGILYKAPMMLYSFFIVIRFVCKGSLGHDKKVNHSHQSILI